MGDWCRKTGKEALEEFGSDPCGLTGEEADRRRKEYGDNVLKEAGTPGWWQVFFGQFKDLLVVILIGAGVVSMLTGDPESTMVIGTVLLLNAALGTVEQKKAERSLEGLKELSAPEARVLRDGKAERIPAAWVVPGDILLLEAGDRVAADGRILEEAGLKTDESSLTGEAQAAEKTAERLKGEGGSQGIAPGDQKNMIFAGSFVLSGRGKALVTATAMDTQLGRIAELMNQTEEKKTPLQAGLDRFSANLALMILGICGLVFALSIYRKETVLDALLFSVALAVAAIPEALGTIVTIVQAMGMQRMAREHAVIKELRAVESLGCVSVVCSDKTGTLTRNRLEVEEVLLGLERAGRDRLEELYRSGMGSRFFLAAVTDNNGKPDGKGGDPADQALLDMALQASGGKPYPYFTRLKELPLDSVRKRMTVVCRSGEQLFVFSKGAPEVMLERCSRIAVSSDGFRSLSPSERRRIGEENRRWAQKGMRVLALAWKPWKEGAEIEEDLIFLGLAAMTDPPRPESRGAVEAALRAGIRTVMITGDQSLTAGAIAERLGILGPEDQILTGSELDRMSEEELASCLRRTTVYARVTPEHKLRIVRAWQKQGEVVAMTGDGVNDAPALRQADIGVAMGAGGTAVSRDAASMILTDDHFATIIRAVSNGRNVYRNIKNSIEFLLSGNMAGIACVLYTSLRGYPLPFTPVQLLFINLITDSLPAIAIGMEPAGEELLRQPPRDPKQGILTPRLIARILIQGGMMAAATMWAWYCGYLDGGERTGCTMAFSTLILARLFHGFNCRGRQPLARLGLASNPFSAAAFLLGTVLLIGALGIPCLRTMFDAVRLTSGQGILVAASAFLPFFLIQMAKTFA